MKFSADPAALRSALKHLATAGKSSALHVSIAASDGQAILTTASPAMIISSRIYADVSLPGSIATPYKQILAALTGITSRVTISATDRGVTITADALALSIPASAHIVDPQPTPAYTLTGVSASDIKRAITQTIAAVDPAAVRLALTGVYFDSVAGMLRATGCGGTIILRYKTQTPAPADFKLNLPHAAACALASIIGKSTKTVSFALSPNSVTITVGDATITSKILDDNYVPIDKYLPAHFSASATVTVATLAQALKQALLVCGKDSLAALSTSRHALRIAGCANGNRAVLYDAAIDADEQGDNDLKVIFNIKVLLSAITELTGSITLKFAGQYDPCVIDAPHDRTFALVMPVRL